MATGLGAAVAGFGTAGLGAAGLGAAAAAKAFGFPEFRFFGAANISFATTAGFTDSFTGNNASFKASGATFPFLDTKAAPRGLATLGAMLGTKASSGSPDISKE
jgi:hypothetical protein